MRARPLQDGGRRQSPAQYPRRRGGEDCRPRQGRGWARLNRSKAMAINGVQTAIFGVDDLDVCTRFFTDFGLDAVANTAELTDFRLPEGSHVILRRSDDPTLPAHYVEGPGVREVIWGVDSAESLGEIENELARDRKVTRDADGTLHSVDDYGLAIGFRHFVRMPLIAREDLVNSPGRSVG